VFGHEHYAGHLEDLACAAVPIRHPISGKAVGAVNLTSWRKDAGRLLIALAQSTARQVTQGLLNAPRKTPRPYTVTDRRIVRRSRAWRVLSWRGSFRAGRGARAGRRAWVQPTAGHR
jgi:transcriptional regulator of acetoin/glycerol metabolism